MSDYELLREYVETGSEAAFARLVERHVNLVYSTAYRVVRDGHRAQDVTQQAFVRLARKAKWLGRGTILAGWLYRTAVLVGQETIRREARRLRREQLAMDLMSAVNENNAWERVEPILEEAMSQLSAAEQAAIVMRYFENKALSEVGAAWGISEDAAQKRVARALGKLKTKLAQRGVAVSAIALGAVMVSSAVSAAPAGVANSVVSAAMEAGKGVWAMTYLAKIMAMMTTKTGGAMMIGVLALGLICLAIQNAQLRADRSGAAALRASEKESVAAKNGDPLMAGESEELKRLREEHLELLRLRGQVTVLENELRQKLVDAGKASMTSGETNAEAADSKMLTTGAMTNHVAAGDTMVIGGWRLAGMRKYIFITPTVLPFDTVSNVQPISLKGVLIEASDELWSSVGWDSFRSDRHRSVLAGDLSPDEFGKLMQSLYHKGGFQMNEFGGDTVPSGKHWGYGLSTTGDDGKTSIMIGVDFYPRVAANGGAVDFEMVPSPPIPASHVDPALL